MAFVSLGIGSVLNYFIFGENIIILPIVVIALCALLFYSFGPGKKIIHDKKLTTLIFCILALASLISIDFIGIRASNWFFHLSISNICSLFLFIILVRSKIINSFTFLSHRLIVLSGITYAFMDFIFVYSFSVLGVSYAFLLGMSSYLPTMVLGSIKYGEGKWYTQLAFSSIAIFCIYIIAFNIL